MTGPGPLTATHWGVYRAEVRDGRVTALRGFEEDPDPSPIGPGIVDALDAPSRIRAPAVRESWLRDGPGAQTYLRGHEPFVEVDWEEAERLVADEVARVRDTHGSSAIYAGSYGWASAGRFHHAQSQLKRFLNLTGGFTSSLFTYSFAAAEAMVPHVLGAFRPYLATATSWRSIAEAGELFVAFGGVPLKNGQIEAGGPGVHVQRSGMEDAVAAGVSFVNVSPIRVDMLDELGAEWIAARPNTDVAIMLGLAHTLHAEGLHDEDFLARYTVGFERFLDYLTGATDGVAKDADWAAAISEVPADTICALARRMAASRTMISVSWSLTRQSHGEQPFWMAITLAAMLGQIGLPGGCVGFGYSATNGIGANYSQMPGASLPQGENPVADFIPVARITDMLENPGGAFEFDGQTLRYPDIRLIWWAGGNPFHHHQDLNRLAAAWQKPQTVIINDWCWTPAAKRADIVLPCATHLERSDIAVGGRDPYLIRMEKAVEPPAGVRTDHAIFAGIAGRMGLGPAFTEGRDEDGWLEWLYDVTRQRAGVAGIEMPGWQELRTRGWYRTDPPNGATVMMADFRADPMAHRLATPSGRIEIFSAVVDGFGYDDCPGHPVWREPVEWLGNAGRHPLHLISNQPTAKLHSQLDQGAVSRAAKINGREPVLIHTDDAGARGIANGDLVRLCNDRGAALGAAVVSDAVRRGVVAMSTGAWWDPDESGMCRHGNPNALTRDIGTSRLGQGPTAHSCLVEIERFDREPPPIAAFDPPAIKPRGAV